MALAAGGRRRTQPDPIQLYHSTATRAGELAGKRVLEVGCGHGGGASYLTRTLGPASYVGLDLNSAGIEFCRRRHQVPGLEFVQGNAENLPFRGGLVRCGDQCRVLALLSAFRPVPRRGLAGAASRRSVPVYRCATAVRVHPVGSAAGRAPGLRIVSWREINAEVLRGIENRSRGHGDG